MKGRVSTRPLVLVGFGEALAAPEVVWSLVDDGCEVLAFTRRGRRCALRHSRHVACHEISAPEFDVQASLSDLRSLLAAVDIGPGQRDRILFPLDDTAVWLSNEVALPNGWVLAGPRGANADLALNKCRQLQIASHAGFNVPRTVLARKAEEITEFCGAQGFPVILKSAECVSVKQNRIRHCPKWICATADELDRAIEKWAERVPVLVQPYIVGVGEGVFGLSAKDGIRAWSAHRRLRMMNPQGSGSSACVSQAVTEDLRCKIDELVRLSGWTGLFMVELLQDQSGAIWFVEINGRPWGSTALSRRQGLEYPAWQVRLSLDDESPVGRGVCSAPGIVCKNVGRELANLAFVAKGPKSRAITNWPRFWRNLMEVLRVRRTDTYYNWRRDDAKVFLADCAYTLKDNLLKKSGI